mmetsp:Transcript_10293/g.20210  ORF Transcript_10293/g.20210 Transcript_10293/m.20210 type:complete len:597 (+) Transcript_10293:16-1806(+)
MEVRGICLDDQTNRDGVWTDGAVQLSCAEVARRAGDGVANVPRATQKLEPSMTSVASLETGTLTTAPCVCSTSLRASSENTQEAERGHPRIAVHRRNSRESTATSSSSSSSSSSSDEEEDAEEFLRYKPLSTRQEQRASLNSWKRDYGKMNPLKGLYQNGAPLHVGQENIHDLNLHDEGQDGYFLSSGMLISSIFGQGENSQEQSVPMMAPASDLTEPTSSSGAFPLNVSPESSTIEYEKVLELEAPVPLAIPVQAEAPEAKDESYCKTSGQREEMQTPVVEEYSNFLETMADPLLLPLEKEVEQFVNQQRVRYFEFISKRKSGRQPLETDEVIFWQALDSHVSDFAAHMNLKIVRHPSYKHASEETQALMCEGMEQHILAKLYDIIFAQNPAEIRHANQMQELFSALRHFVTPEQLEVPECCRSDELLLSVQNQLARMAFYKFPAGKLQCIVQASSLVMESLLHCANTSLAKPDNGIDLASLGSEEPENTLPVADFAIEDTEQSTSSTHVQVRSAGADDFFPAFLYAIMHSNIPSLWLEMEFIRKFRNPSSLCISQSGYFFASLQSAVEFLEHLDPKYLGMTQSEFDQAMKEATH